MSKQFKLEIISPEKIIYSSEPTEVVIPSYEGYMTILYDHSADKNMQDSKWIGKKTLKPVNIDTLPKYIFDNKNKFKDWIDS